MRLGKDTTGVALVGGAVLCAGLLAGCGSAEEKAPTGEPATNHRSTAAQPEPGASEAPAASAAPKASSLPATPTRTATPRSAPSMSASSEPLDVFPTRGAEFEVAGARTGSHESFDRFVVELRDVAGTGKPGWWVDVTQHPTGAASGLPESYEGQSAVIVTVRGVRFPGAGVGGDQAAKGAPSVTRAASERLIRSVEDQSWWEGDHRYLIGVGVADPHVKVNYLESPPRVVVDIAG